MLISNQHKWFVLRNVEKSKIESDVDNAYLLVDLKTRVLSILIPLVDFDGAFDHNVKAEILCRH